MTPDRGSLRQSIMSHNIRYHKLCYVFLQGVIIIESTLRLYPPISMTMPSQAGSTPAGQAAAIVR